MSETLFVVAVALTAVYALLLECATAFAGSVSAQAAYAGVVVVIWGTVQLHERHPR